MAGVAVTVLLEKLPRLRAHHAHLKSGIDKELELLQIELSALKEFLLEHDEEDEAWRWRPEFMKKEIQEIVYSLRGVKSEIRERVDQVEDTIDAELTQIIEKNLSAGFLSSDWQMKKLLMRIGELKEVIGKRFPEYSSKMKPLLKTGNPQGISGARAPMTTLPPIQIDINVVGRDREEETIIGRLMESREELDVISIEGVDGVGKTTLARRIYLNTKIAYEFPVRIWIHASYNFKRHFDDTLRNILRVFTSQDIDSLNHKELSENVMACLENKKFLLVLDNTQDPYILRTIENVLPKSYGMGKVLITTQFCVGWHDKFRMRLDPLSRMDGYELLQLKVFGNLKLCPTELVDIGGTIAEKCCQIPLLIILVGGILMGQLMKSNITNTIKDVLEVYGNVKKDLDKVSVEY